MVSGENKTMRFMKQDFVMMVLGIVVYVADVGADLWVAKTFFCGEQYLWCAIMLVTGFISSVVVQYFSYIWFKEDNAEKLNWTLFLLHFLHGGIFTRYWFALKYGYRAAYKSNISGDKLIDGSTSLIHKRAIDAMADISMLRLFKTYLESTPQLILQIYILMTSDVDVRTFSQYVSITVSFSSISCATVDYQIALRKSLPDKNTFSMIPSKITYFSYKLLTLTSWILSIALVTVLSIKGSIILLGVLWLGGISWVLRQHTSLCKSKAAEVVYRIIVGIILTFTFFNVKGEKTKIILCVYYVIRVLITLAILCACMFCKSLFNGKIYLLSVIAAVVASLVLGIVSLSVYYRYFHPSIYYEQDVVDGRGDERNETCRIRRFLIQ